MTILLLLATLALSFDEKATTDAAPALTQSQLAEIDALLAAWDHEDTPGCGLGVLRGGKLVLARGYGAACLEHGIPNSPRSVFRIGSTSKQFTAACIHHLSQDGTLSLDDDIRKYVPELPERETPVTVRHLLHHTSGIRDYLTLYALGGRAGSEEHYDVNEVLALLARQRGLNFEPGSDQLYSNSGYFLLSVIVERASGRSLREYAEERIFGPLEMTETHFHDDHREIVPGRAEGYSSDGKTTRISRTTLDLLGDGGVFTTVEDLAKWARHLRELRATEDPFLQAMLERGTLSSGKKLDYASGLVHGKLEGAPMISHGGAFVGFRAQWIWLPEQDCAVICLANSAEFPASRMAREVAKIVLGAEIPPRDPEDTQDPFGVGGSVPSTEGEPEFDGDALDRYAGTYFSSELDCDYTVEVDDDRLVVRFHEESVRLVSMSARTFRASPAIVRFDITEDGAVTGFQLDYGRIRGVQFERR